jgi:hypothetical protein
MEGLHPRGEVDRIVPLGSGPADAWHRWGFEGTGRSEPERPHRPLK